MARVNKVHLLLATVFLKFLLVFLDITSFRKIVAPFKKLIAFTIIPERILSTLW